MVPDFTERQSSVAREGEDHSGGAGEIGAVTERNRNQGEPQKEDRASRADAVFPDYRVRLLNLQPIVVARQHRVNVALN